MRKIEHQRLPILQDLLVVPALGSIVSSFGFKEASLFCYVLFFVFCFCFCFVLIPPSPFWGYGVVFIIYLLALACVSCSLYSFVQFLLLDGLGFHESNITEIYVT